MSLATPRFTIVALSLILIGGPTISLAADGTTDTTPAGTAITAPTGSPPVIVAPPAQTTSTPISVPSTNPDSQQIPDFLKDYATPAATSISPPPTTATAPVGRPPTVIKPVPTQARPSVTEAPKAPPSSGSLPMLKGRLEEVAGTGAKLPVGFILGLKAQKGRVDPTAVKPHVDRIKGLVASFPADWQGNWGGQLKIHWTQMDKASWDFDAAEAKETQDILRPGTTGTTTFSFYQDSRSILLQPARVTFPPRTNSYASREMQNQLKNSPFASMLGNNPAASQMFNSMATGIPVMYLGDLTGVGVTGNQLSSRVVKNVIKELKPGVLEQNIVAQEAERQKQTGQVRNSYSETVLRFTKINTSQLYVQAATLKYRSDGQFLQKVIMYGTVNRGQNTENANPFSGLPGMSGSFPGLPSSPSGGMGGFGDLNKMLKDLQQGF